MKRVKILFIMLLLVLLSGCSANYNLDINTDGIVETVTLSEDSSVILTYSTSVEEYVDKELSSVKTEGTYSNYSLTTRSENGKGIGEGIRKYSNLDNLKNNSIILSEMFENILIKEENNIVTITMVPKDEFEYFEDNFLYTALLEDLSINIKVPYRVLTNNADYVKDNVLTWNMKQDEDLKTINLSYNNTKIITDIVPPEIWAIIAIVGVLGICGLYVFIRYKRNSMY